MQRIPSVSSIALITGALMLTAPGESALAQSAGSGAEGAEQQDATGESTLTEVLITGSRVRRPNLDSNSPLTTVSSERLQLSSQTNVVESLQELPAFTPSRSPTSGGQSGFTGSFLDLRGLGRGRTLVLVDGRRWINTISDGGVDVSTIPPELVERVDIVTGGASATYGSDAVAGVVNFILKRKFDGLGVNAQRGVTDKGETMNTRVAATGGDDFADGRGGFFIHASYDKSDEILANGRSFLDPARFNVGGELVRLDSDVVASGAALVGSDLAAFSAGGDLFASPGNINALAPAALFNEGQFARVQIPAKKFTLVAGLDRKLNDRVRLYSDAIYIREEIFVRRSPASRDLSGELIAVNSPFLAPATQAYLATLDDDADGFAQIPGLSRRFTELGRRAENNDRDSYRISAGFEVDLSNDWKVDTTAIYSESNFSIRTSGQLADARLSQALDVVQGANGPECRTATFAGVACVPVNIFGAGNITPEAARFLTVEGGLRGGNADTNISSVLTGNLWRLPAGPIGVAFGLEHRRSTASEIPNEVWRFGLSEDQLAEFTATLKQAEAFGEAVVPLLSDAPFAHHLGLELGVRYTSFDPGEHAWTHKLLAEWSPIEQVRFRGGLQRATRAPNAYELGAGDQSPFPIAAIGGDPCFTGAPLAGDLRNACVAGGVPQAVADAGGTTSPADEFRYTAFGNPNLLPETAKTWTFGAVLDNLAVQGLSITTDYYDIDLSDVVSPVGPQIIFDRCYFSGTGGADPLCAKITRDPDTGMLASLDDGPLNVGGYEVKGIDFNMAYARTVSGLFSSNANFNVNVSATHLLDFIITPVALQPDVRFNCAGLYGPTCQTPRPDWQATTRFGWSEGAFSVALSWNWIGEIEDDATAFDPALVPELARTSIERNYFDLSGIWHASEALEIRGGIENLFDTDPPVVGVDRTGAVADNNTLPGLYDAFGRRFFLGVNLNF